jgi:hypothetical protein
MAVFVLDPNIDIRFLQENLWKNDELQVLPYSFFTENKITQQQISMFCLRYGVYNVPTVELCEWIRGKIGGRTSLEIGAGNGALGRYLKIPSTDSFLQSGNMVSQYYELIKQPPVQYGKNVEKITANRAVERYKPQVVIAAWLTQSFKPGEEWRGGSIFGTDEGVIIKNVEMYLHIGHLNTHGNKRVLDRGHTVERYPWVLSRSLDAGNNAIFIWEK